MRGSTIYTGPLGSTVHVMRADAATVTALAAIDWNRAFPLVCLDHVRGLITLMTPSRLHEDLAEILSHVVSTAGAVVTGVAKGLRSTRLRGPEDPPGTGMEPDCAFYVGERARGYQAALVEGEAAADAFLERTAPDLVVEVEITSADEGKTAGDVCEAVDGVRFGMTPQEQIDAVTRIVRRRQRGSVRAREEDVPYAARSG